MPEERVITLIALFRQTGKLMVDELIERLRAAGYSEATAAHHPLFENIDPEGTRLTVLAARAGMTHQPMGELVGELERHGYLERLKRSFRWTRAAGEIDAEGTEYGPQGRRGGRRDRGCVARALQRAGFEGELRPLLESALRERAGVLLRSGGAPP